MQAKHRPGAPCEELTINPHNRKFKDQSLMSAFIGCWGQYLSNIKSCYKWTSYLVFNN